MTMNNSKHITTYHIDLGLSSVDQETDSKPSFLLGNKQILFVTLGQANRCWKPMGVPPGTWSTTGESSKSMLVSSRVTMWWIQLPHPFPDNCIQQDINCGNTASLRYPGLRYHDPQKWICFSSGGVLSHGGIPMSSILIWLSTTSIHLIHMFPLETSGYWGNPIALRNSYCIFFHFVSRKKQTTKNNDPPGRNGASTARRGELEPNVYQRPWEFIVIPSMIWEHSC